MSCMFRTLLILQICVFFSYMKISVGEKKPTVGGLFGAKDGFSLSPWLVILAYNVDLIKWLFPVTALKTNTTFRTP